MACKICGGKSGFFPLCPKCFKLRDDGKVIQCEKCKNWHLANTPCECENSNKLVKPKYNATYSESTCSKCGKPSGKYDICYDCFRRKTEDDLKRDIESLIESEKDSGVDVRNKWPAKIRTQTGHKVRSHAECRIADWLANNGIVFEYERMVVSKNDRNKFLLCDFYIPHANIYLEYWGYKDKETYNKRRNEKKAIYDEKELVMEDIEDTHLEALDDCLRQILSPYFKQL